MVNNIVFGLRPTGEIHLGHIYSIVKYKPNIIYIADYHAISIKPEKLRENILETIKVIKFFLPNSIIFLQSNISNLLYAFFKMLNFFNINSLKSMHLNKASKNLTLFEYTYVILMCLDIIALAPDTLIIGKDQNQHVEFLSNFMKISNNLDYIKQFKIINVPTIFGVRGNKMSSSLKNYISFNHSTNEIINNVKLLFSGNLKELNFLNIDNNITRLLSIFESEEIITKRYQNTTNFVNEKKILLDYILDVKKQLSSQEASLDFISKADYLENNLEKFLSLI